MLQDRLLYSFTGTNETTRTFTMTDETGEVWVLDANLLAKSDTRQYQVITYTISMHISIFPERGVGIRTLKNFPLFQEAVQR